MRDKIVLSYNSLKCVRRLIAFLLVFILVFEVSYNTNLSAKATNTHVGGEVASSDATASIPATSETAQNATTEVPASTTEDDVLGDENNSDFYTMSYWKNHMFPIASGDIEISGMNVYLNGNSCVVENVGDNTVLYNDLDSDGEVDDEDQAVAEDITGKNIYGLYNQSNDKNLTITIRGGKVLNIYGGYNATTKRNISISVIGGETSNIYGIYNGMCRNLDVEVSGNSKCKELNGLYGNAAAKNVNVSIVKSSLTDSLYAVRGDYNSTMPANVTKNVNIEISGNASMANVYGLYSYNSSIVVGGDYSVSGNAFSCGCFYGCSGSSSRMVVIMGDTDMSFNGTVSSCLYCVYYGDIHGDYNSDINLVDSNVGIYNIYYSHVIGDVSTRIIVGSNTHCSYLYGICRSGVEGNADIYVSSPTTYDVSSTYLINYSSISKDVSLKLYGFNSDSSVYCISESSIGGNAKIDSKGIKAYSFYTISSASVSGKLELLSAGVTAEYYYLLSANVSGNVVTDLKGIGNNTYVYFNGVLNKNFDFNVIGSNCKNLYLSESFTVKGNTNISLTGLYVSDYIGLYPKIEKDFNISVNDVCCNDTNNYGGSVGGDYSISFNGNCNLSSTSIYPSGCKSFNATVNGGYYDKYFNASSSNVKCNIVTMTINGGTFRQNNSSGIFGFCNASVPTKIIVPDESTAVFLDNIELSSGITYDSDEELYGYVYNKGNTIITGNYVIDNDMTVSSLTVNGDILLKGKLKVTNSVKGWGDIYVDGGDFDVSSLPRREVNMSDPLVHEYTSLSLGSVALYYPAKIICDEDEVSSDCLKTYFRTNDKTYIKVNDTKKYISPDIPEGYTIKSVTSEYNDTSHEVTSCEDSFYYSPVMSNQIIRITLKKPKQGVSYDIQVDDAKKEIDLDGYSVIIEGNDDELSFYADLDRDGIKDSLSPVLTGLYSDYTIYGVKNSQYDTPIRITINSGKVHSYQVIYNSICNLDGKLAFDIRVNGGSINEICMARHSVVSGAIRIVAPREYVRRFSYGDSNLSEYYYDNGSYVYRIGTYEYDDKTPPKKIKNLKISYKTQSSVMVKWDATTDNEGVTGYKIYRNGEFLTDTDELSYKDLDVNVGEEYKYAVRAYDSAGNESIMSDEISAKVLSLRFTGITHKLNDRFVSSEVIGLNDTLFNVGINNIGDKFYNVKALYSYDDENYYEICSYNSTSVDNTFALEEENINRASLHSNKIYIKVLVSDSDNNSISVTKEYRVDNIPPVLSSFNNIISNNNSVTLSWFLSDNSDFKCFHVYRKTGEDELYIKVADIDDASSYKDVSVVAGVEYDYYITAEDIYENVSEPLHFERVTVSPDVEPPVIKGVTPKSGSYGKITIRIDATDNIAVTKYVIDIRRENGSWETAYEGAESKYEVTEEGTYDVRAYAFDLRGNKSEYYSVGRYNIDLTGPSKPVISDVKVYDTYVTLDISACEDRDYSRTKIINNDTNEELNLNHGNIVSGLKPNKAYNIKAVFIDKCGNVGEYSDVVSFTTKSDTVPPSVSNYSAKSPVSTVLNVSSYVCDNVAVRKVEYIVSGNGIKKSYTYNQDGDKSCICQESINVSSLNEGIYKFFVKAEDVNSNTFITDKPLTVIIDHTPPSEVTSFGVKDKNGKILISISGDAYSYIVKRREGNAYITVDETKSKTFYDYKGVETGHTYYYTAYAKDEAGNVSVPSKEVKVTVTEDNENPVASITDITLKGNDKLSMTYNARDNVELSSIDLSYKVIGVDDRLSEYNDYIRFKHINSSSDWLSDSADIDIKGIITKYKEFYPDEEVIKFDLKSEVKDSNSNCSSVNKEYELRLSDLDFEPPSTEGFKVVPSNRRIQVSFDALNPGDNYKIYRMSTSDDEYSLMDYKTVSDEEIVDGYIDTEVDVNTGYKYRLVLEDAAGNSSSIESGEYVYPKNVDDELPVSVISGSLNALVNDLTSFSASESSDNVGIKEYHWDFGDGITSEGLSVSHKYTAEGEYKITLKVTDYSGNIGVSYKDISVIKSAHKYTVSIKNDYDMPLSGAMIILDGVGTVLTDEDGKATFAAVKGRYNGVVFKNGYESETVTFDVNEESLSNAIVLDRYVSVTGRMTVKKMTMDELVESGIDLDSPEASFNYQVEHKIGNTKELCPYYLGEQKTERFYGSGGSTSHTSANHGGTGSIPYPKQSSVTENNKVSNTSVATNKERTVVFAMNTVKISVLKDHFLVTALIHNDSKTTDIVSSKIELNCPEGLTVVKSYDDSDTAIGADKEKEFEWIVRGDVGGQYNIKATFEGITETGEVVRIELDGKANARDASDDKLHLYIFYEDIAYRDVDYYVQYKLVNEGNETLNYVKATFGSYETTDKITRKIYWDSDKKDEIVSHGEVYYSKGGDATFTTRNGDSIVAKELKPRQAVYGTHKSVSKVTSVINYVETLVDDIKDANRGLRVTAVPVKSHYDFDFAEKDSPAIATTTESVIPTTTEPPITTEAPPESNSSTAGDPVDVATGAYKDEQTVMSLNGGEGLALKMSYDSRYTDISGDFGYGWTHNYEKRIVSENGMLRCYLNANSSIMFVPSYIADDEVYADYNSDFDMYEIREPENKKYELLTLSKLNYALEECDDGYVLKDESGDLWYFDLEGKLIKTETYKGIISHISYSAGSMTIKDPYSNEYIKATYNEDGYISKVVDSSGRSETFSYNNNSVSSRTNPNNVTYSYDYDSDYRLIKATDGEGLTYVINTYDSKGRVLTQDDGDSSTPIMTFTYDDKEDGALDVTLKNRRGIKRFVKSNELGMPVCYTNALSEELKYEYNDSGYVSKIVYEDGTTDSYKYSGTDVIEHKDRGGVTTTYTYDDKHNPLSHISTSGTKHTYTYDSCNRVLTDENERGIKTSYTYNDAGQVLSVNIEGRGTTAYQYDNKLRLHKVTMPNGLVGTYTYDDAGFVKKYTDSEGRIVLFTYDKVGNLLRRRVVLEDGESVTETMTYNSYCAMTSYTDPNGNTTRFAYDNDGRLIKELYADGTTKSCIRDGEGNITKVIYPSCNGGDVVESATYDNVGNLNQVKNTLGGITHLSNAAYKAVNSVSSLGENVNYTYDSYGRILKQTDTSGNATSFTYDNSGNIKTITSPDGYKSELSYNGYGDLVSVKDAEGNETELTYNDYGEITSVTDSNGNSTSLTYDSYGNCIKMTEPCGQITTYEYDKYGNVISETKQGSTSTKNRLTEYDYDLFGRVVAVRDALDNEITVDYDACGNVTDIYDAEDNLIKHTDYDNRNRAIKETDANGAVSKYSYDDYGNVISENKSIAKDTKNGTISTANTSYTYTAGSYLTSVKDALGNTSKYTYDSEGNITSMINPNGGVTDFTYDIKGNLTGEYVKNGSTHTYTYNAENLLKEKVNSCGQKTKYTYDKTGKLIKLKDEEGTITYTYDSVGNVLTVTEIKKDGTSSTISRTYDEANRVKTYKDADGNVITYDYNEFGELIKLTYPDGKTVTYDYDKNGNMISVTDYNNRVTRYEYNSNGQMTRQIRPDESVETYEYDAAGQITKQLDKAKDGTAINSYEYTYNLAGNITSIKKDKDHKTDKNSAGGNKTSENAQLSDVTMEYSSDNRLVRYNGKTVSYDAEGNMTYGPLNGDMVEFTYDSRNRLVKAGEVEYTYDAENNRIAKKTIDSITKYVIDSNAKYSQVLMETNSSSASGDEENKYFVYGQGLIYEEDSNGNLLIHHYDQVGSTTALTDLSGNLKETYEYSPYGEMLSGDSSLTQFLYNGSYGVITDTNGLYYMRARYYNPTILRFINQDVVLGVLTDIQSLNRYAYCEGNPVSFLDPFGLERLDTSGLHTFLGIVNILAAVISWGGFPEIGYVITAVASVADIGLLIYDLYVDVADHKGAEYFASDMCKLVFDILGIATGGVTRLNSLKLKNSESCIVDSINTKKQVDYMRYEKDFRDAYSKWDKRDGIVSIGGAMELIGEVILDFLTDYS